MSVFVLIILESLQVIIVMYLRSHLLFKVPWPADSEVKFSVFKSSCYLSFSW